MTVRRTMMFCADTMRIFSSITTRASVSIEAVLFSVFRTGVLSYLRVFTKTIIFTTSPIHISIYTDME